MHQKENQNAELTTTTIILGLDKTLPADRVGPLVVKSEVTIRPFFKAMESLRRKIAQKLLKSVDFTCINQLMELLKIPQVDRAIRDMISEDRV